MAKDEVLVVGAGPVGLTMASELTQRGIKVRIIDKNTIYIKDSRVVGIHHLEELGVKVDRDTELNNLELKEDKVELMIKSGGISLVPD